MKLNPHRFKSMIFTLIFTLFLLNTSVTAAQEVEGSIDDIARALMTYFPKVSGKVVAVNNNALEVDLGPSQGLAAGVLLTVFRKEEPFHHPITHVHLGHFEGEVGLIEVVQFTPDHLKANHINPIKKIEVGDFVRLPSTKITLGIAMQSKTDHAFLMNELSVALRDTGRFQVETLPPESDFNTAFQSGNVYYIGLKAAHKEEQLSMNLLLQNTSTGKHLADLNLLINQSENSGLILEHLQYQLFEQRLKK